MYCPLQEAYQIPTFATRRKKSCAAPAFGQMQGQQQQQQQQQQPQMALEQPYDPYGMDEGLGGQAPAFRRYGREDFADAPTTNSTNANRDMSGSAMLDNVASNYAAQKSDIMYYGSSYGMKFPKVTTAEGFADIGTADSAAPLPSVPSRAEMCAPKDTSYRIPLTGECKKAFDSAMNAALTETQSGTNTQWLAQQRNADMSGVTGYYDEDLEQYLRTSDMKAAPMPSIPSSSSSNSATDPYDSKTSPFATALATFKGRLTPSSPTLIDSEQKSPFAPGPGSGSGSGSGSSGGSKSMWSWLTDNEKLLDLILFILCGLVVIFLCEQLYRLALMTGMKDTLEIIRPYVEKASP